MTPGTFTDPVRAARALRFIAGGARWDPILDLTGYIERFTAVRVKRLPLPLEFHAALAYRPPARPIVVVNRRHPESRQNFSVAHELGHWVLHEGRRPAAASRSDRRRMEWEADRFAVELLLPAPLMWRCLAGSRAGPSNLARRLGLSATVVRRRLREVDLTSPAAIAPRRLDPDADAAVKPPRARRASGREFKFGGESNAPGLG